MQDVPAANDKTGSIQVQKHAMQNARRHIPPHHVKDIFIQVSLSHDITKVKFPVSPPCIHYTNGSNMVAMKHAYILCRGEKNKDGPKTRKCDLE